MILRLIQPRTLHFMAMDYLNMYNSENLVSSRESFFLWCCNSVFQIPATVPPLVWCAFPSGGTPSIFLAEVKSHGTDTLHHSINHEAFCLRSIHGSLSVFQNRTHEPGSVQPAGVRVVLEALTGMLYFNVAVTK